MKGLDDILKKLKKLWIMVNLMIRRDGFQRAQYLKKKRNNKLSRKQRLLILRQLRKITETEQKAKEDEHLNK